MHFTLKFLILISIFVFAKAGVMPTSSETENENAPRDKRQLAVIPGQQQQQPGILGLGQNIPIIGTLVSGLPILGNGQNILGFLPGNLGSGLGGLTSGLTGTLGNLGGTLGNLGGLGGLLGGTAPSITEAAQCPASQKLSCRCEPLVPIKPLGTRSESNNNIIEIIDQSARNNADGSTDVLAELSNGITLYQKIKNPMLPKDVDGYFSLKVGEERYLTIYYTINNLDYTVKANVHSEPPKTLLEMEAGQIVGGF